MQYKDIDTRIGHSLRKQISAALLLCAGFGIGLGGVAVYAEINGAVIGSGKVIVQGRTKNVQHRDGGIVGKIFATEGQKVNSGDLLFTLDRTLADANLGIIDSQLDQLLAQEARLLAEQADKPEIDYPDELLSVENERSRLLVDGQTQLREARRMTMESRKAQLVEQVNQYQEKVQALEAQRQAVAENIELLDGQIEDFAHLHSRGLIADSQYLTVRREMVSLIGSKAAIAAEIQESKQAISQTELQKVQIDEDFREGILTELDQKRTEIARLKEERIAAMDRLSRLEIRAPISGYLHELNIHTVGGIVSPGETMVSVIPVDDELIVEARLSPTDVDQVFDEQIARLRFSGLDQRVTPELFANVIDVSPDLMTDKQTGVSYFLARLRINDKDIEKIGADKLRPGMPVEVFIQTGARSILSYLVKPIVDQVQHAMRET
ncbi:MULTISPECIES: HlyD family type I secretion periplasmic adaptor subunit [Brucella]|uniref:HlyD family type I secretion periplasmic adaptor subunit n=1 Tax=Brucella TaxID=234 RepID=UPI000465D9CA|nr:HlyD family type I secretion periplasmic adaptor subunit [Brucella rhizosphaerae]